MVRLFCFYLKYNLFFILLYIFVITLTIFRIYFVIHVTFYRLKSNQKAFAPAKNLTAPY